MKKLSEQSPESRVMEQQVLEHAKTAKIVEYGPEALPAGPEIDSSSEIIVVEGRADILNLLRAGIKNTIAMNGAMLPQTIKDLSRQKEITLFVDGDRGGILISKDAVSTANIAFIARAPDGKEVEELAEKEINLALRAKMKVDEFKKQYFENGSKDRDYRENREDRNERKPYRRTRTEKSDDDYDNEDTDLNEEMKNSLKEYAQELKGSKSAAIFAIKKGELKQVKKISSSDIVKLLYGFQKRNSKISALIVDDLVTNSLINIAEQLSCKMIIAKNFAATSNKIEMVSL